MTGGQIMLYLGIERTGADTVLLQPELQDGRPVERVRFAWERRKLHAV